MGARVDAILCDFQERTGIRPVNRLEGGELLSTISKEAYELIQFITREECGLRDGDGNWYGCDPIYETIASIYETYQDYQSLLASKRQPDPQTGEAPYQWERSYPLGYPSPGGAHVTDISKSQ